MAVFYDRATIQKSKPEKVEMEWLRFVVKKYSIDGGPAGGDGAVGGSVI